MSARNYNPFLYPACRDGFVNMAIIIVLIYVSNIVAYFLSIVPIFILGFLIMILTYLIVYGYFFMYLNQCMRDSASGGLIAPGSIPGSGGFDELREEFKWALLPFLYCFIPLILYSVFAEQPDRRTAAIVMACGLCFYPMVYLRAVIIGDITAFNPIAVVFNIIRFLPGYLILLAGIMLVFAPMILISIVAGDAGTAALLSLPWFVYSSVVMAHLIGRFYCLRSDKFDWM